MIFFRPDGAFADAIPYYDENSGKYFIFYLHDYRDAASYGIGVDWDMITTTDFVNFEEHGTVIKRGQLSARDLFVFTGGVLKREGGYSIFYTGFSPFSNERGEPAQVVLKADSEDLIHWRKDESFVLAAPDGFERDDWRDPFVWHDKDGKFRMLLAARKLVHFAPRFRGQSHQAQNIRHTPADIPSGNIGYTQSKRHVIVNIHGWNQSEILKNYA